MFMNDTSRHQPQRKSHLMRHNDDTVNRQPRNQTRLPLNITTYLKPCKLKNFESFSQSLRIRRIPTPLSHLGSIIHHVCRRQCQGAGQGSCVSLSTCFPSSNDADVHSTEDFNKAKEFAVAAAGSGAYLYPIKVSGDRPSLTESWWATKLIIGREYFTSSPTAPYGSLYLRR
jgi:hypothetical protein